MGQKVDFVYLIATVPSKKAAAPLPLFYGCRYLRTLSFLLREDYITSATGLTGYFGHLKAWDVAVRLP